MSEDTQHKYYNRAERRKLRREGTLVRFRANGEQVVCHHLEDMWCSECIAQPKEVSVELPDGTISKGYVISNL